MTPHLLPPTETVVIPFFVGATNGQREACLAELKLETARMIPGTRVVLAAVRDVGSAVR